MCGRMGSDTQPTVTFGDGEASIGEPFVGHGRRFITTPETNDSAALRLIFRCEQEFASRGPKFVASRVGPFDHRRLYIGDAGQV